METELVFLLITRICCISSWQQLIWVIIQLDWMIKQPGSLQMIHKLLCRKLFEMVSPKERLDSRWKKWLSHNFVRHFGLRVWVCWPDRVCEDLRAQTQLTKRLKSLSSESFGCLLQSQHLPHIVMSNSKAKIPPSGEKPLRIFNSFDRSYWTFYLNR